MNRRKPGSSVTFFSTGYVAKMFGVDISTIKRWADMGEIPCVKTLGGHRRFTQDTVQELTVKMNFDQEGTNRKSSPAPGRR
jgi:excisionase family DNA binding protein